MFQKFLEKHLNFPHNRKNLECLIKNVDGLVHVELECLDRCAICRNIPVILMDDEIYKIICYDSKCLNSTRDYEDLLKCCVEWNLKQRLVADKI